MSQRWAPITMFLPGLILLLALSRIGFADEMDALLAGQSPQAVAAQVGEQPAAVRLAEQLQQLQGLVNHPAVQTFIKLAQDKSYVEAAQQVRNHPNRGLLLYGEIGLLLLLWGVRIVLNSNTLPWYRRMWTRLWTFGLYFGGASFVLPWVLLGEPYVRMLKGLGEVGLKLIRSFGVA